MTPWDLGQPRAFASLSNKPCLACVVTVREVARGLAVLSLLREEVEEEAPASTPDIFRAPG